MSQTKTREFVYGSYGDTHQVYSKASSRDSSGRKSQLSSLLKRYLPSSRASRILDFGCGDGTLLSVAQALGYSSLFGVDISPSMTALAKERTSATIVTGDGLEYLGQSGGGSFDAIVAFDIFEHLTRDELLATCRRIADALRPGGVLLVHVPNGASPFYGRIRWGDITHELAFTVHALGQLLTPLGFVDIQGHEDAPVAHGLKSTTRNVLWQLMRLPAVAWLIVETGQMRGHILTQNMVVTARRPTDGVTPPSPL